MNDFFYSGQTRGRNHVQENDEPSLSEESEAENNDEENGGSETKDEPMAEKPRPKVVAKPKGKLIHRIFGLNKLLDFDYFH